MSSQKTVWVIGAGFSQALGGPLLTSLLNSRSRDSINSRFPNLRNDLAADWAYSLYESGLPQPNHLRDMSQWGDAEKFLVSLEESIATRNSDHRFLHINGKLWRLVEDYYNQRATQLGGSPDHRARKIVDSIGGYLPPFIASGVKIPVLTSSRSLDKILASIREVAINERAAHKAVLAGARRVIAAECMMFFEGHDVDSERFLPYKNWLYSLDANDTVVSFNYDLVLDWACELDPKTRAVVLPPDGFHRPGFASILKLHGSANWLHAASSGSSAMKCQDAYSLSMDSPALLIGTPGRTKSIIQKALDGHWKLARDAIAEAERIAFIGYRLPESDASAKQFFQEAMAGNRKSNLQVRIILGANQSHEHVVRLRSLLQAYAQHNGPSVVHPLPMNAEDYLEASNLLW